MESDDAESGNGYKSNPVLTIVALLLVIAACNKPPKESLKPVVNTMPQEDTVVAVKKKSVPKKKKKTIYLTFDDGPNKGTSKVMQIADAEQLPITMFFIGEHVYGSKAQLAIYDSIMKSNFIEIANHSFTHAHHNQFEKFYAVPDSVVKDFVRCADSLSLPYKIIRTPGRNIWRTKNIRSTDIKSSTASADSLQQNGFTAVGWDIEWHFDGKLELECTGDILLQQIDSMFAKGYTKSPDELVVLAHDQAYADANDSAELHSFFRKLKAKEEYGFDVISNYPGIK
jgi:hypothetical protein